MAKKFGTRRVGTGTVAEDAAASSARWIGSAASQLSTSMSVAPRNVKAIPLGYIKEDPENPRKLAIGSDEVKRIAADYPIDCARLESPDAPAYLDEYLELIEEEQVLDGKALGDFRSIATFAFALKSADRLLQPVTVWQDGTQFYLLMGERRFLAHLLLRCETIDATIREAKPSDFDKYLIQWQENFQREGLTLHERLGNLRALLDHSGIPLASLSVDGFAALTGLARSPAHRYLVIIKCESKALHEAIARGEITSSKKAATLAAMPPNEINALLTRGNTTASPTAREMPVVKVGKARDYGALSFALRAAAEKLADDAFAAKLQRLDLNRQKDVSEAFRLLLEHYEMADRG
jgi:ParB-like chromosome segregation protein Spo0J